jgi:gentisate 1,2-dioxygenase
LTRTHPDPASRQSTEQAFLFRYDDRPMLRELNFLRDEEERFFEAP